MENKGGLNIKEEKITVFSENIFKEIVQEIDHPFIGKINSYFSDEEAKEICLRSRHKKIRNWSKIFFNKNTDIDYTLLRYYIHDFANNALELFGGNILTFLLRLKKWPKDKKNVKILKSDLSDPISIKPNSPMFPRLIIEGKDGDHSYSLTFSTLLEKYLGNYVSVTIKNQNNSKTLKVSLEGKIFEDFENCIPEIAIFKVCIDNEIILYCGYDDDVCDICGRPLEDIISIKYGRGPICRKNYGMPAITNK